MLYQNHLGECYTYDELVELAKQYNNDTDLLATAITGIEHCDEYADDCCDMLYDTFNDIASIASYRNDGKAHFEGIVHILEQHDSGFEVYELWHRCGNLFNSNDQEIRKCWLSDLKYALKQVVQCNHWSYKLESGLQNIYWDEDNGVTPTLEEMLAIYREQNGFTSPTT